MSTRARLVLDVGVFAAFVAAYSPRFTGLSLHEWLGLALLFPVLLHLTLNWDWVTRTARRFMQRVRAGSVLGMTVDALLFLVTVAVMLSGVMVSRVASAAVGLTPSSDPIWRTIHSTSADMVIALAVIHLVLHWRWIVGVVRRMLSTSVHRPTAVPIPLDLARVTEGRVHDLRSARGR